MENNIFSPVVLEPTADSEDNVVVAIHLVVLVVPITDNDVKGCGLNE